MMLGDNIEWKSGRKKSPHVYAMGCDLSLVGTFPGCSSKYYRINSETGAAEEISEAEYEARGVKL